jgi:predicted nucleic acid-binding protein
LGLAALRALLSHHSRIALDTSVFIYQLEEHPHYVALTDSIFDWLEQGGHSAATSTVTMLELLVKPYRDGCDDLTNQVHGLLSYYPNLRWVAPDLTTADIAAKLRALHRLTTPDALQAACAIETKATALITNDPVFERVGLFKTITLDRFLTGN